MTSLGDYICRNFPPFRIGTAVDFNIETIQCFRKRYTLYTFMQCAHIVLSIFRFVVHMPMGTNLEVLVRILIEVSGVFFSFS